MTPGDTARGWILWCVSMSLWIPLPPLLSHQAGPRGPAVSCHVLDDADERVYRLIQMEVDGDPVWLLSLESVRTDSGGIRLPLYGAAPVIDGRTAALSYQTANGGKIVDLRVTEESASLDVYVSYELEVNVEVDLAPEVDLLNTDGPITDLRCDVSSETGSPW